MLDIRPTILDVRCEKYRNGQEKTRKKSSIFTLPHQSCEKGETKKNYFTPLFEGKVSIEFGHFFLIDEDAHQTIGKGLKHHLKGTIRRVVVLTITTGEFHAPLHGLRSDFLLREGKITDHRLGFAKPMKGERGEQLPQRARGLIKSERMSPQFFATSAAFANEIDVHRLKPRFVGLTSRRKLQEGVEGRRKRCIVHDFAAPKLARKLGVEKQRAEDTRLRRHFHWFACIVLRTQKRSNATKIAIKTKTPPFSDDFIIFT